MYHPIYCLIGNGLKELLFLTQIAWTGTIIHIHPSWVSYTEQTDLLDKKTKSIRTTSKNNYLLQPDQLETICQQNPHTDFLLIFNQPCNPTGLIYPSNLLEAIGNIINQYKITVLADEIYFNLTYPHHHIITLANVCPTQVIRGCSLSKNFASGGWRAGWLTFPAQLEKIYQRMYTIALSLYSCISHPILYVIKEALTPHPELEEYLQNTQAIYQQITSYIYQELTTHTRLHLLPCQAAWYLFLDFEAYKKELLTHGVSNSGQLGQFLLQEMGLVTVPGSAFHYEGLCLRYSCVDFRVDQLGQEFSVWGASIQEGITTLIRLLGKL